MRLVTHWSVELTTLLLGLALLLVIADALPPNLFTPGTAQFFFAIGFIGIWRYSWWCVHLVRALIYNLHHFPALRRKADAAPLEQATDELFILCTSFRIAPHINFAVYRVLILDAMTLGIPVTIFASLSDRSDVDAIEHAFDSCGRPAKIHLHYLFQRGDGKRSAMGDALRAISRRLPSPRAQVVLMDGDVQLEPGTLPRSLAFFAADPELGALTTNNQAIVDGGDVTRAWYALRHAQRHLMMSSMALSRRLLVLTGRYSVFRADITTDPGFIELVENDSLRHWRLGHFKFLSGDDKSTWFWLLKRGYTMRYLPDVFVTGIEALPDKKRFFYSTRDLMQRWFGNMLRTSGRAIHLGPRRLGFFVWWCLVDQRISMWTTLVGPTIALLMTLFIKTSFLFAYLLWVTFTRCVVTLVLGRMSGRISLLWVPLLYYNQVAGALIKTYVMFRLNRQSWTRQGISSGEPRDRKRRLRQRRLSRLLHGTYAAGLLLAISYGIHLLQPPDALSVAAMGHDVQRTRSQLDERWLLASVTQGPSGSTVQLPGGTLYFGDTLAEHARTLENVHAVTLIGQRTTLVLSPKAARLFETPAPVDLIGRITCGHGAPCKLKLGNSILQLNNVTLTLNTDNMQPQS
ncbi:MAG TPA: glycosyltransferase [Halomonas sp.]|nr:glycosyltransferase [Halomonas sp.]